MASGRGWLNQWGPLLGLLLVGLLVRVWFPAGILAGESLSVAAQAADIAQRLGEGLAALRAAYGLRTLALHLPRALLYSLGGVQPGTTFLLPMALSLANIALVYRLGGLAGGRRAAFLAGLWWCVLPLEVLAAVTLDGFAGVVPGGLLVFNLLADERAAGLNRFAMRVLAAGLAGLLLATPAGALQSATGQWLGRPEWLVLLPVGLGGLALMTPEERRLPGGYLTGWLVMVIAYLFVAGYRLPLAEPLAALVWLGPVVWAAVFLGRFVPEGRGWVWLALGVGIAAGLSRGMLPLAIPRYETLEWLGTTQLATLLVVGRGLALLGLGLLAVAVAAGRRVAAGRLAAGVALGLSFSLLLVVQNTWQTEAGREPRWAEALEWVNSQKMDGPLLVDSGVNRLMLDYLSGFDGLRAARLGEDWTAHAAGLALLGEEELYGREIPGNWLRVATFGAAERPRLAVFQILSSPLTCADVLARLAVKAATLALAPDSTLCDELATRPNEVAGSIVPANRFAGLYMLMDERPPDGWSMYQKHLLYPDGRTFDLQATLDPDAFYRLTVTLRSEHPITALYLRVGARETAYGWVHPREDWQNYTLLISTAGWAGPQRIWLAPFLADNYSRVDVREFELVRLTP